MSTNVVTVTAQGKKPVSFTFQDVGSVKTPIKTFNFYGDSKEELKAGNMYDKVIEFFTNIRDAHLSKDEQKSGAVIDIDDFNAFQTGKKQITGYEVQRSDEFSVYKKENGKVVFDICF